MHLWVPQHTSVSLLPTQIRPFQNTTWNPVFYLVHILRHGPFFLSVVATLRARNTHFRSSGVGAEFGGYRADPERFEGQLFRPGVYC